MAFLIATSEGRGGVLCGKTVKSLAPGFLLATPSIGDGRFNEAVVLMLEHTDKGAMGLVVNRQAPLTLKELASTQEMTAASSKEAEAVFMGGPVETERGFVLHNCDIVPERVEILPGLFLSVTLESLKPLLLDENVWLRFCLGYAGWGAGQMEKELSLGAWLFTEASSVALKDIAPEELWAHSIQSMGINPLQLVPGGGVH